MKTKKKLILALFILTVLIILTIILWNPLVNILNNLQNLDEFVKGFGILSIIIFIFIFIAQIVLAPIPGQIVGIAGGYIFGFWGGLFYSMIGLFIGSLIVFYLSRKFGRIFVQKFIKKEHLEKYDKKVGENGELILFLIYLIPFLPDDLMSFIAGLTNIKIKKLMTIAMIGRFPSFVAFSLIGSGLNQENLTLMIILISLVTIISILAYLKKDTLEKKSMEFVNKIKNKTKSK